MEGVKRLDRLIFLCVVALPVSSAYAVGKRSIEDVIIQIKNGGII